MTAGVRIDPTASVAPDAQLGSDVEIGAGAIVGPCVTIGDNAVIAPRAILERNVKLGARCKVGVGSVIGGNPQDLKYRGEETWVEVGDDTVIREYTTVNRGTTQSYRTTIGSGCLLMTYVHLGHDCHVGDGVILSNLVQLAGHVHIDEKATLGGMTGVHQFVSIGAYAFIGGFSKVAKDVPPYLKVDGNPARPFGLNVIGLRRQGFSKERIKKVHHAYRILLASKLNTSQALERLKSETNRSEDVQYLIDFIENSERGVIK